MGRQGGTYAYYSEVKIDADEMGLENNRARITRRDRAECLGLSPDGIAYLE